MGNSAKQIISKKVTCAFDKLNGSHPLKKKVPTSYVGYNARFRKDGSVRYFNYDLAREMGLIDKSSENTMTSALEKKILKTFSLIIINEFDLMNDRVYPANEMIDGEFMATRYLQLQHADKTGKNSGDGRSIWNGRISHKGINWDVSSCGTGATRLSPATSKFNKFFENGDPSISYGCGYSEIDEGYVTALFSDIFKENNIATEQTLALIEFEKGYCIRVRAHQNLLRPSHFFCHLKQNDLLSLTQMTDFYISDQVKLGAYPKIENAKKSYDHFLEQVAKTFSSVSARFEDDYIFCWLDWDGDNILMDGGIIDYGSIRQFGIFHSEYRYDDDDRFSTNILEQKDKARYIVQTFAQLVDYIKTGDKKPITNFKDHGSVLLFDKNFEFEKNKNLLIKVGFSEADAVLLTNQSKNEIIEFRKTFSYFEKQKTSAGEEKVSDGVTWNAIFNMRDLLREYPQILMARGKMIEDLEFMDIIKTEFANEKDLELNSYRKSKILDFQKWYKIFIGKAATVHKMSEEKVLLSIAMRSSLKNRSGRITGDAISHIVDLIMKKSKKMTTDDVYSLIKYISQQQSCIETNRKIQNSKIYESGLLKEIGQIIKENRVGI